MTTENDAPLAPQPFRRSAWRLLLVGALAGGGLGVGGTLAVTARQVAHAAPPPHADANAVYQCPMHPTVTSDHRGTCPICGMKLVAASGAAAPHVEHAERKVVFYRSPMDPKQTSPVPRKDEMGMDYVPVYADELAGDAETAPGLAAVKIEPERQQLIGLRTAKVAAGPVGKALRTTGKVAVDESRVRKVSVKVDAYVERIYADFTGKPVARGEPLVSLYSPDLLAAQHELLLALKTREALSQGALAGDGDTLVEAARSRLKLWDLPDSTVAEIERTRTPLKAVPLRSPASGVVTTKSVVEGAHLNPGDTLFEITDLSQVWVVADAYEADLHELKVGLPASFTLKALPGRSFTGKVAFIDPELNPETRTVRVRLQVPNPRGELKPEMFGEVLLKGQGRRGLVVPLDAVLDAGTTKVVFVSLGDGKFEPREVTTGTTVGESVEIRSGLRVGEEVVVRANFLVDSESRLKAALAQMSQKPQSQGGAQ